MARENDPNADSRKAYQKWFTRNRAALNLKRRSKYREDTEHRRRIVARQAGYRSTLPPKIADGKRYRVVEGTRLRVYSISEAAELVGRSLQTLRIWETKEWIPPHTTGGVHRFYTEGQVQLMIMIAAQVNRLGKTVRDTEFTKTLEHVFENWKDA